MLDGRFSMVGRRVGFARMLVNEAGLCNESYQWQVRIFRQQYGQKATFNDNATPMPPTLLFQLKLKSARF
jgi:hypothetical protein